MLIAVFPMTIDAYTAAIPHFPYEWIYVRPYAAISPEQIPSIFS